MDCVEQILAVVVNRGVQWAVRISPAESNDETKRVVVFQMLSNDRKPRE